MKKKLVIKKRDECVICYCKIYSSVNIICQHKFCIDCITTWTNNNVTCPYCRTEIVTFHITIENIDMYVKRIIEFMIKKDFIKDLIKKYNKQYNTKNPLQIKFYWLNISFIPDSKQQLLKLYKQSIQQIIELYVLQYILYIREYNFVLKCTNKIIQKFKKIPKYDKNLNTQLTTIYDFNNIFKIYL